MFDSEWLRRKCARADVVTFMFVVSTEKPSASMKIVSPQEPLYTGDRVTIQCNIPEYTDWTYVWYRDNQQLPSETSETITISLQDKAGQYQCHGKRTCWPSQSYPSSYLPISVRVSPHGLLYSGESVTLQCDISDYTDWTYRWYRNKKLQSSGSPSKIITPLSDQVALYQCQGRRTDRPKSSQRSVSLHISVTGEFTIKSPSFCSDKQDILTGDSVTLTCTVESSGWRFYWYRHRQDSEPVAITSRSSYKLSQVSVSDGGHYRCRAGRGDPVYYTQYSEPVHIQVTGESKSNLVGVVVGLVFAAVLLTLILVLLCRYKNSEGDYFTIS
uniref:Ig-like domain-containing protein n=1 Tax=Esox lucius TaxID=8010 RepID=A0A6Q2YBL7_ESOLU